MKKNFIYFIINLIITNIITATAIDDAESLYSLEKEDLLNIKPYLIKKEILKIKKRNEEEKIEIIKLNATNQKLCNKKKEMEAACPQLLPIADLYSGDSDLCGEKQEKILSVDLINDEDSSFIFRINDFYLSTEFSKKNKSSITFHSTKRNLIKPPRFIDILGFEIITVESGKGIHFRKKKPTNLKIKMYINNKPLMPNHFLLPPSDSTDQSAYLIDTKELMNLKNNKNCFLSLQEILEIENL
jgi:hypothetical protein